LIVTGIREKLLIFMHEKNMTQKELCREIEISEQHFIRVMKGEYTISERYEKAIEDLFKREQFYRGLYQEPLTGEWRL
jgi:transcriptional regulator with XRE-family HTH domain